MASPNSSPKASWNLRRITPNSEQKSARKFKKVNRKIVWEYRVFVGGRVGYSSSSIGPIVACKTSSLISSLTLSSAFSAIISSIPAPYVRHRRYRSSPAAACFTFEVGPRFADDLMTGVVGWEGCGGVSATAASRTQHVQRGEEGEAGDGVCGVEAGCTDPKASWPDFHMEPP